MRGFRLTYNIKDPYEWVFYFAVRGFDVVTLDGVSIVLVDETRFNFETWRRATNSSMYTGEFDYEVLDDAQPVFDNFVERGGVVAEKGL